MRFKIPIARIENNYKIRNNYLTNIELRRHKPHKLAHFLKLRSEHPWSYPVCDEDNLWCELTTKYYTFRNKAIDEPDFVDVNIMLSVRIFRLIGPRDPKIRAYNLSYNP